MTHPALVDLLAHLEAERFTPGPREHRTSRCDPPAPITAEQAAANLAALRDAVGDLRVVGEGAA